ncbi:MAG TPA: NAD(P)/FAD-dependent oxidoreductase [Candidatus Thermoplasmatota archaeon]|nr:NAD(P)/FAD-dependent oxidoreductase [Candidatus Thermoplasmatota archaeon]
MVPMLVDIVGGSLSGLSTAISIKERNPALDVVVHEKYKTIGHNHEGRRCGEAHTVEHEWSKWEPEPASIFDEITQGSVSIGKHYITAKRPPHVAFILNRQEFICQLARDAEKKNVHISTGDHIKSVHDLDGSFIVDASGCPSSIKRELGFGTGHVGVTYQQTLQDANCFRGDSIQLIFMENLGYYWVFPRDPTKREMNVGVGTLANTGADLRELLETFKEQRQIKGTVSYVVGGLVPLGLQYPLMHENILFVGDAGVGTFPINGQGIYRALISGDIAGQCIGTNHVRRYPHLIHRAFVKWNLIGVSFLQLNLVLRRINPTLFLSSLGVLTKLGVQFHQLTI